MLKIDLEIAEKLEVFVVFDAIAVRFPSVFVISSITLNYERTSYAIHFWRERCSVLLQKHQHFFVFNIIVFKHPMSTFWSVLVSERWQHSTKIERLIHSALREIFAVFGWKTAKTDRKKSKKLEFGWFPSFSEFCWDWKIVKQKLRIALDDKIRSTAPFLKRKFHLLCQRVASEKPKWWKKRIFMYLHF